LPFIQNFPEEARHGGRRRTITGRLNHDSFSTEFARRAACRTANCEERRAGGYFGEDPGSAGGLHPCQLTGRDADHRQEGRVPVGAVELRQPRVGAERERGQPGVLGAGDRPAGLQAVPAAQRHFPRVHDAAEFLHQPESPSRRLGIIGRDAHGQLVSPPAGAGVVGQLLVELGQPVRDQEPAAVATVRAQPDEVVVF
jgi:hypothetical protein